MSNNKNEINKDYTLEYEGKTVVLKPILSLSDYKTISGSVIDLTTEVTTDLNNLELFEYIFNICILSTCTDYKLPESSEEQFELVYSSNPTKSSLFKTVMNKYEQLNSEIIIQISDLHNALRKKIDFILRTNASAVTIKLNESISSFEDMANKFNKLLEGVDAESISKIVTAIGDNGKIDESKLVDAFIENKNKK